jgi:putative FmdB family regulatory protein
MPIYEYRCDACGATKEAIQRMSDASLTLCEACGQEALARIISRTSFVLKGTGWYATDYKPASKEAKADQPKSETKTETKSDAAPTPTSTSSADS